MQTLETIRARKLEIIKQAEEIGRNISELIALIETYDRENYPDYLGASDFFCTLYPFTEDLNEYPTTISQWCESMHEKLHNVYEVEECQFPLEENAEWNTCQIFTNAQEAQSFAERHYDSQTNYTQNKTACTCEDCREGWKVSPDSWKSYSVQVTQKTTTKKAH